MIWSKYLKRFLCSKSRFVISVCESNEMREHMEEVIYGIIKRKMWSKCYCRTSKSLRLSNTRCKITEKYTKRRQVLRQLRKQNKKGNSYTPGGFSTKIIPMLILQSRDQFPKYKHKMCAKLSPLFPILMCKLL